MSHPIAGRITLNLVIGIVVTILTVTIAVWWMAEKQNAQAQANTATMVVGGIVAMEDNVKAFANDYAWWEAGYNAYMAHDEAWVDANFGSGIRDTQISDILVIIAPDGTVPYAWAIDDDHGKPREIFSPDIRAKIKKLAEGMPVENEAARPAYFRIGNDILLIAVARIAPVSRASEVDPATLPFLVQGVYLKHERLHTLGKQFLIEDLGLDIESPDDSVAAGFPPIKDFNGNVIGAFVWTPPTPGFAVLRNVLAPIAGGLLVFCVIAMITVLRARKLALSQARSERQAIEAARTDSLTGLVNRFGFNELSESAHFEQSCARGEAAIIYLDVNGFKSVNDSIGHQGGDELVTRLAERLSMIMPPDSHFARVGGDEFALALTGRTAPQAVAGIASAMVHSLDQPFSVAGFQFQVTAAVGYAIADNPEVDPAELLRRADLAMYQAKNAAERDAVPYHSGLETGALHKKRLGMALRNAIEANELSVAYQPIVRAGDLAVVSVEALVRWNSTEFGRVSPAEFIPVAEETGFIHDIGRFVFDRACRDLVDWPGLKVSINVSPAQLRDPDFANDLGLIARRHDIVPNRFKLELTEGLLVRNPTIAKRKLARLKSMGFGLSLDDFGTGFSSIGYLRQFPFDWLKIDKSFIAELGTNPTANALIQSMIALGDAMDIAVVAEGIETAEQLNLLRLLQCEYVQGYHLAKPMAAGEITALLARLGDSRRMFADAATAGYVAERGTTSLKN
ncbi:EAL domain-containing protein [Kaistia dalseonensis]|uniref:Diguanylate cyclase (GGDEF)-like protein n=1 Tax=Kaistia dalseonensis TaxID=410840 RepID=A0ABU0H190_9HYPH|nr:EAL domain-containing protein [Kaistia dalseonensis]MCX5493118.1 EAL domain-containing protein [Kaistia dalseonensis]MDQ0435673.1 diguanylate cyclase (GGDEF)-like protein [Kaistia dalseonensis]